MQAKSYYLTLMLEFNSLEIIKLSYV